MFVAFGFEVGADAALGAFQFLAGQFQLLAESQPGLGRLAQHAVLFR